MRTYAVFARSAWRDRRAAHRALGAMRHEVAAGPDAGWVDGYVIAERPEAFGVICLVAAEGPERIRDAARVSGVGVDEIRVVLR